MVSAVDVAVAVREHIVQHQLHTLRRGKILLSLVVDDGRDRPLDVRVTDVLVVEQLCDALTRRPLHADVLVVSGTVLFELDDSAALFRVIQLLHQIGRSLFVERVDLRMVELKGIDPALADRIAVSLVDVLLRFWPVEVPVCIDRKLAAVESFGDLRRIALVGILQKAHALSLRQRIVLAFSADGRYTDLALLRG